MANRSFLLVSIMTYKKGIILPVAMIFRYGTISLEKKTSRGEREAYEPDPI